MFASVMTICSGAVHAAGSNVLVNGDFETGTTSGWSPVSATLSVAGDAHGGQWAGRAANNGASTFGLRTSSRPVAGGSAGAQYTAAGFVRSDTPGMRVCTILTEYGTGGSQVGQTKACVTSTSTWAPLATATRSLLAAGDSLGLAVRETTAGATDSFEVDDLSLVQESFTQTAVAVWHMDDTSGPMVDSGALPANDGTLTNVVQSAAGINGTSAYSFTKGYVTVPDEASLDPGTANVTLDLWAAPASLPTSGDFDMIRKGDSPSQQYKMEILQTGALLCGFRGSAGSVTVTSAAKVAPNTGFHEFVCTKSTTQITASIDGATTSKAANIGSIVNSAPVTIGAHTGGGSDYYKGRMDEVSVTLG